MKKIFLLLIVSFFMFPLFVYASFLDEVPPYIYYDGIDEKNCNIVKTIEEDNVVIEIFEKNTGDKYSWSFNKNKIKDNLKLNFNIDLDTSIEPIVENETAGIKKMYVDFSYHGELPSKAHIKLDVSKKFDNGNNLYLYYFNDRNNEVEFISDDIKVVDGEAEFEINHCSKYILTNAIVNDVEDTPKILSKVIVTLIFMVIALMAYTLFKK